MESEIQREQSIQAQWIKIVTVFLYISVVWSMIEAGSSIYFGQSSNDLSLFAFGIDSLIEVFSASLVLYHMKFRSLPHLINKNEPLCNHHNHNHHHHHHHGDKSVLFSLNTERKLTLFIGYLLIIFCVFACIGGSYRLIKGVPPRDTVSGIIIGGICIFATFIMWYYKIKGSVILHSSTLASDAACSMGCIKLSTVLCIGSILFQIWNKLWWIDSVTAIIIGFMVGHEGYHTIQHAKDKDKFGGGCCGGTNHGLAKYFRQKYGRELANDDVAKGLINTDKVEMHDHDHCCDGHDDPEISENFALVSENADRGSKEKTLASQDKTDIESQYNKCCN